MPNRQGIWDKSVDGAMTVGVNKPYLGTQQMYVPTYMADRVSTVEDLRDPEVAAMFDKDGNGKGEYWAGDAGWKSTRMWQVKFKSYGLTDLWEREILPDATFKARLKTGFRASRRSCSIAGRRNGCMPPTTSRRSKSRSAQKAAKTMISTMRTGLRSHHSPAPVRTR